MLTRDFLWGGATAANQYEGGYNLGGRGLSVIDFVPGSKIRLKLLHNSGVDIYNFDDKYHYPNHHGSQFYDFFEEDLLYFKEMGFKVYRMSISWSRIYPTGFENEPNQEGLEFYRKLFLRLKEYQIEPLVTICHFDMPVEIARKLDGWYHKQTIDLYLKYAKTVLTEYSDLVSMWIPFNEMNVGAFGALMPIGVDSNRFENPLEVTYQAIANQLVANAECIKVAKDISSDNKIGTMIAAQASYAYDCNPKNQLANVLNTRMFRYFCGDTQVFGEIPQYAINYFKQNNIKLDLSQEELNSIRRNTVDFLSFSYYSSSVVDEVSEREKASGNMFVSVKNPFLEQTKWGWTLDADGFRIAINELYDRYRIPLFVAENGLGAYDIIEEDGIHDQYRIEYLSEHIKALEAAIEIDGADVFGYTMWGCIDLVSAGSGQFDKRYGLVHVNYNDAGEGDFKRTRKDSFYWYQNVIKNNGL